MTTFRPDIILLDMNFSRDAISGQEGFDSLKQILSIDPQAVVIFMTAYADTDKAVRAIKAGATDFIPKPWEKEKLLATLSSGMKLRRSRTEINLLKEQVEVLSNVTAGGSEEIIIGDSPVMQQVFSTVEKLQRYGCQHTYMVRREPEGCVPCLLYRILPAMESRLLR